MGGTWAGIAGCSPGGRTSGDLQDIGKLPAVVEVLGDKERGLDEGQDLRESGGRVCLSQGPRLVGPQRKV